MNILFFYIKRKYKEDNSDNKGIPHKNVPIGIACGNTNYFIALFWCLY